MKRFLPTIYAIICTLMLCAGLVLAFVFAWQAGVYDIVYCVIGTVIGFIFAPIVHEFGHIVFAKMANMRIAYVKCFCLQFQAGERSKLRFCSPFAPDETQAIPKSGGDMRHRATLLTVGGLIFSGIFLLALLTTAILFTCLGDTNYLLWSAVPYPAYLFLLNVMPLEYASGKTDALVLQGIRKGYPEEKAMLAAMQIQGELYAGKTFGEIDERLYYDVPQLCEEQPLYAVTLNLRYRYHIQRDEYDKAADCLNRLAVSQAYLLDSEVQTLAAELVYMHAIGGDTQRAKESANLCKEYLSSDTLLAKRALAAYMQACGEREKAMLLLAQAEELLQKEWIRGVADFEKILLSRLSSV